MKREHKERKATTAADSQGARQCLPRGQTCVHSAPATVRPFSSRQQPAQNDPLLARHLLAKNRPGFCSSHFSPSRALSFFPRAFPAGGTSRGLPCKKSLPGACQAAGSLWAVALETKEGDAQVKKPSGFQGSSA